MTQIIIQSADGTEQVKQIKNWGFLLKNWRYVSRFEVRTASGLHGLTLKHSTQAYRDRYFPDGADAHLTAYFEGLTYRGKKVVRFEDTWNSASWLFECLNRPVFKGAFITWDCRNYVIGSTDYQSKNVR